MLHCISCPNFIILLPLLLEILGIKCTVIIYCPVHDVINFEMTQSVLIKPFYITTKKSGKKGKYLKNEKSY